MKSLSIGPIVLRRRPPSMLWKSRAEMAVIRTTELGVADASEADRSRWLQGFRRLLDGLETPLQVAIEITPGPNPSIDESLPAPRDFDEMRGADLWFADQISQLRSAGKRSVSFAVGRAHAPRILSALREIGVGIRGEEMPAPCVYGTQRPDSLLYEHGFSRTWYIDRWPGLELEPGWIFNLLPPGLHLRLAWHATPLPTAWIVT